jgi:hypothetical protein
VCSGATQICGCCGHRDTRRRAYDTGMNKPGWHHRELRYDSPARAENAQMQGAA